MRAADRILNKHLQEGHTARHGGQTLHKASKKWASSTVLGQTDAASQKHSSH